MNKNLIPSTQNHEDQLRLLRARRELYGRAKGLLTLQLILAVGLPAIGALFALSVPELRPYVASAALLIAILDVGVIDRSQRMLLRAAAKVQEQFDCAVLELPWNHFLVGARLEPEAIYEASTTFSKKRDDSKIRDWYPIAVGEVPLHLARVICQRTNLWYDSTLRRRYSAIALAVAVGLSVVLFMAGLGMGLGLVDFVISVLAPASPIIIWSVREYYRQRDTAETLDRLRTAAEQLWEKAKAGQCPEVECSRQSREFQDAIYQRRATSPLILDWIYWLQRTQLEAQMNAGASEMVKELPT